MRSTHTPAQRAASRRHRSALTHCTRSTVRLWLRAPADHPPPEDGRLPGVTIDVPAHLYLNNLLALHHEIRSGVVLNTRALVISHVRTGMRIFDVRDGKAVALKVMAVLMQASEEAWYFGEFGVAHEGERDARVQAALEAAMVVMHGEGWRERYTRKREGTTR